MEKLSSTLDFEKGGEIKKILELQEEGDRKEGRK